MIDGLNDYEENDAHGRTKLSADLKRQLAEAFANQTQTAVSQDTVNNGPIRIKHKDIVKMMTEAEQLDL